MVEEKKDAAKAGGEKPPEQTGAKAKAKEKPPEQTLRDGMKRLDNEIAGVMGRTGKYHGGLKKLQGEIRQTISDLKGSRLLDEEI